MRSHEVICYGSSSCGGSFEVITRNDCCTHGIGSVGLSFLNSGRGDCQPCPVGKKNNNHQLNTDIPLVQHYEQQSY